MNAAETNTVHHLVSETLTIDLPTPTTPIPYTHELSLTLKLLAPTWPLIITFGLVSNVTNIAVFLKAGVKDNVMTLLLSLALSDLTFLTLMTPTASGMFMKAYGEHHSWPFDPQFVLYFFYWPAFTAYDLSAFISVSLGVMRCACVATPLKFKLVFTKSRTVTWVLCLAVLAVTLRVPVLTIFRVASKLDPETNATVTYLKRVNGDTMSRVNDVMNRGVVIWVNFTAMVTSVCVLSFKLFQSSKIRHACTNTGSQSDTHKAKKQKTHKENSHKLQSKDLQVIKSVVLICAIFILAQAPFLIISTIRLADPDFSTDRKLRHLFTIISQTSVTLSYLNASLNIFVYYKFNSRYRAVFLSMLS